MAVTLMDAAVQGEQYNPKDQTVIKMFMEISPIAEILPFDKIDGNSYTYYQEGTLPGVQWRGVNQSYSESTGVVNPLIERLMILGGEVKIDNYIVNTQPSRAPSEKRKQFMMKTQAAAREFSRAFFEGSDLVDINELVGLRRRITGSGQLILQASGGGALTLAKLDDTIDAVTVGTKHIFSNRFLRRKAQRLAEAAGNSVTFNYTPGTFGKPWETYAGIPWHIVEDSGDGTSLLDDDEDPGDGASDTGSLYVVGVGEDGVHGIFNGPDGKSFSVKDFGELEGEPRHMGRVEAYLGMAIKHPRSAARLYGILNT